jgi:hypothetical protein
VLRDDSSGPALRCAAGGVWGPGDPLPIWLLCDLVRFRCGGGGKVMKGRSVQVCGRKLFGCWFLLGCSGMAGAHNFIPR